MVKIFRQMYKEYVWKFNWDSFSEETIAAGYNNLDSIDNFFKWQWTEVVESFDIYHNSR